jgi:hypothetical protein
MKITVEAEFTPLMLAEAFCDMGDEDQAQFFIECTAIMGRWGPGKREMQAHYIGGHLKTCACSNEKTRDFIGEIAYAATESSGVTQEKKP